MKLLLVNPNTTVSMTEKMASAALPRARATTAKPVPPGRLVAESMAGGSNSPRLRSRG